MNNGNGTREEAAAEVERAAVLMSELPNPADVAKQTSSAVTNCYLAAEELRSIGETVTSMAHSLSLQCNAVADEFVRKADVMSTSVSKFASIIYDNAKQICDLRANLDKRPPAADAYGVHDALSPAAETEINKIPAFLEQKMLTTEKRQ